jgi:hypothetical protein
MLLVNTLEDRQHVVQLSEKQNGMGLDIARCWWHLQPGKPLKVEGGVLNARMFETGHLLARFLCRDAQTESRVAFESAPEVTGDVIGGRSGHLNSKRVKFISYMEKLGGAVRVDSVPVTNVVCCRRFQRLVARSTHLSVVFVLDARTAPVEKLTSNFSTLSSTRERVGVSE